MVRECFHLRLVIKYLLIVLFCFWNNSIARASVGEDLVLPLKYEDSKKVLLYGAGTVLVTTLLKHSLSDRIQRDLKEDHPLCCHITSSGNSFLQIFPNILYSASFGLDSLINDREKSKNLAFGMAKATLYSGLVTDTLKFTIHERRPDGTDTKSFPSGHTTTAFAFASFVASEHSWVYGVPAYAMASFVAFCRMHDSHHYFHDVLAGATIGLSYGIAHAQKIKDGEAIKSQAAIVLVPTENLHGFSFQLKKTF